MWITLGPPPRQSHRVIKGLITLFLFLFTFNSTDTAEIWNTDVTPGVCVCGLFVQTFCYWAHICTLFPWFPNVLFPWVAWILPADLLCQSVSESSGDSQVPSWSRRWWMLQCLSAGVRTPGVGRGQAQVPPRSSNQPLAPARWQKRHWIYRRGQFLWWVQPEQLKVEQGKWPIGVSGGLEAGEFCWHTIHQGQLKSIRDRGLWASWGWTLEPNEQKAAITHACSKALSALWGTEPTCWWDNISHIH